LIVINTLYIYNVFNILFIIFILILFITGLFLLIRSIQLRKKNVFYISLTFILIVIGFIGNILFNLTIIFEETFVSTGFMFSAIFTYSTFYKNSQSARYILISIFLILVIHYLLQIIYFFNINFYIHLISKIFDIIGTFIIFAWMSLSSYTAYKRIMNENIEEWIKLRYKLISFSAIVLSLQAIPELFIPYNIEYGDPTDFTTLFIFGITLGFSLIFSIGFFVAWILPKQMKKVSISINETI